MFMYKVMHAYCFMVPFKSAIAVCHIHVYIHFELCMRVSERKIYNTNKDAK